MSRSSYSTVKVQLIPCDRRDSYAFCYKIKTPDLLSQIINVLISRLDVKENAGHLECLLESLLGLIKPESITKLKDIPSLILFMIKEVQVFKRILPKFIESEAVIGSLQTLEQLYEGKY